MFSQDGIDGSLQLSERRAEIYVIIDEVENDLAFLEPSDHRAEIADVSKHTIDRPANNMIPWPQLVEQSIPCWPLLQQAIPVSADGSIDEHAFGLVIREACRGPPNIWQGAVFVFDCIIYLGFDGHRARN